ncbi:MAG: hypothetical protein KME06_12055 [Kastovskya adunca ATA6-11-RM4]|jgi:hypothetical protein|nr:hypothetical protein [Kastovskya adunca ATA6-11-RM4]
MHTDLGQKVAIAINAIAVEMYCPKTWLSNKEKSFTLVTSQRKKLWQSANLPPLQQPRVCLLCNWVGYCLAEANP